MNVRTCKRECLQNKGPRVQNYPWENLHPIQLVIEPKSCRNTKQHFPIVCKVFLFGKILFSLGPTPQRHICIESAQKIQVVYITQSHRKGEYQRCHIQ